MATVPDERLDKLAVMANTRRTVYAQVEYVDVAAVGAEALKETAFLTALRPVDALIHVLRAFEDDSIPHVGAIDPLRDIKSVEFDLMLSDLTQIEKRLERLEKVLKKGRTTELEHEQALLIRSKAFLEEEHPLRELEMTVDEKKLIKGFMFLSQKPVLYAVNVGESTTLDSDMKAVMAKYNLAEVAARPNSGVTAFCGKVEAEPAAPPGWPGQGVIHLAVVGPHRADHHLQRRFHLGAIRALAPEFLGARASSSSPPAGRRRS